MARDETARRRWALTAAASLALLAACTEGSPAPTDPSSTPAHGSEPESSAPPRAEQVWSLDAAIIGQPQAAGDVALVYVEQEQAQELALVGVDAVTGEQLWSQPASPGEVVPGIAVVPTVLEGADGQPLAAYFRPDPTGNLFARLVLADPRTGKDVFATAPLLFGSTPRACSDDRDVCVQARSGYDGQRSTMRLRLADGSLLPEPESVDGFVRGIGPEGLSDVRPGGVEYLARVQDGAVVWKTPIDELFAPGYSTDGGWAWNYYPDSDLFVGFVGQRPVDVTPNSPRELNLAAGVTIAIDASTGRRRWRDDGSLPTCSGTLPLPLALSGEGDERAPVPVRCRYEGAAVVRQGQEPMFDGLDVSVEGFDLATGETTWTLPLGAVEGLVFSGGVGAVAGPQEVLLPGPDGPVVLNVAAGTTRDPAPEEVFACASETVTFDYREPYYANGVPILERLGGTLTVPCLPDGSSGTEPLPPMAIEAVALEVGDLFVLAAEGRLIGYRIS